VTIQTNAEQAGGWGQAGSTPTAAWDLKERVPLHGILDWPDFSLFFLFFFQLVPQSPKHSSLKQNLGITSGCSAFEVVNCFSQGHPQQFHNHVPGQAQASK